MVMRIRCLRSSIFHIFFNVSIAFLIELEFYYLSTSSFDGSKFGFKNINRVEYKAINLDTIQKLAEAKNLQTVGINDFIAAGFISSSQLVKVLGNGTLTAKLDVQAHAFSKTAVAAIEAAGGQVVKL